MDDERENGEDDYEPGSFGDLDSGGRIGEKTRPTRPRTRWPMYAVPLAIAVLVVTFAVYMANDARISPPPETETRALVPHRVARDQTLRPGARTVDIDVYDRNITKGECAALMNEYAWRAGNGRVAVWQPGSGPTADAAGSNSDHAAALCLCHFDRNPPECYFHLPLG